LLALVTGSTDGIGKATALILAKEKNFDVIVHGRTKAKAESAIADLVKQGASADHFLAVGADFSSFSEVREMSKEIIAMTKDRRLDVVVHNAGIFVRGSAQPAEAEGMELTMVVNHFSPFLLQHLITPAQEKAKGPRVIFVSSGLHRSGNLPDKSASVSSLKAYRGSGNDAYSLSKWANVATAKAFVNRLPQFSVFSLHPGVVSTKMLKSAFNMSGVDVDSGAATSVFLASADVSQYSSGDYFVDCKKAPCASTAENATIVEAFYKSSCEIVGVDALPLAKA